MPKFWSDVLQGVYGCENLRQRGWGKWTSVDAVGVPAKRSIVKVAQRQPCGTATILEGGAMGYSRNAQAVRAAPAELN